MRRDRPQTAVPSGVGPALRERARAAAKSIWKWLSPPGTSSRPLLIDAFQLEDRILLSASPLAGVVADPGGAPPDQADSGLDQAPDVDAASDANSDDASAGIGRDLIVGIDPTLIDDNLQGEDAARPRLEIVFLDTNASNSQQLLDDLLAQNSSEREFAVHLLDGSQDGVDQISEILSGYSEVDAVHLISESDAGQVKLGNVWLGVNNIDSYAGELASWNSSLRSGADLIIYGSDMASNHDGRALAEAIGALCDCDVLASDDAVDHDALSGDWSMELSAGITISEYIQDPVANLLELVVVDTASDILDGDTSSISALTSNRGSDGFISLREAIIAANNTAGLDTISFNIAGAGVHTIFVGNASDGGNGELPDVTDAIEIRGLTQPGSAANTLPAGDDSALMIELDGTFATGAVHGLHFNGAGASGSTVQGLIINRFTGNGIEVTNADDVVIVGNFIGLDSTGTAAAGNTGHGIAVNGGSSRVIIGGETADLRNVISGNTLDGVNIVGAQSSATVIGNFIGTNAAGTAAVGNRSDGIEIQSAGNQIGGSNAGNVIAGNIGAGVNINGNAALDNQIQGNLIGTNSQGEAGLGNLGSGIIVNNGADRTIIGTDGDGTNDGSEGNVISGNTGYGIRLQSVDDVVIAGNYIGTTPDGTSARANSLGGILLAGSATDNRIGTDADGTSDTFERNVISGNGGAGITISASATGTKIAGNSIGTQADGVTSLGNAGAGVLISGSGGDNTIGGTSTAARNVIAFNAGDGVTISAGTGNSVRGNSIHSNSGLALDLESAFEDSYGVTDNDWLVLDLDGGANNLQNFPDLQNAASNGTSITINGNLDSTAFGTFEIDFFASTSGDASGHGEGMTYLGSKTVSTGLLGTVSFSFTQNIVVPAGARISATATNTSNGDTSEFSLNVTLTGPNDAPTITSSDSPTVNENTTIVQTLTAFDPNSDPMTFSISGGADSALFTINGANQLVFLAPPDFEAPNDADGDNVYEVRVTANDGNGGTATQSVSVTVLPVNDNNPVFTSSTAPSIQENTTVVQTLSATDADGDSVTFSIAGGSDAARFTINGANELVLLSAPDFDSPSDADADNIYEVQVEADDGNGGTTTQTISVTILPLNDNSPVFTSSATPSISENSTVVHTLTATDADADTVTFSISGGVDASQFTINGSNELVFLSAPDYEAPVDSDGDNVYEVQVTADDGSGRTTTQSISVTVLPVNDNNPVFTSGTAPSVDENTTVVQTLTATDADADTVTFSITGGADAAKFAINGSNELIFVAGPDFDVPGDADADNVYRVVVTADDGQGGTTTQTIGVQVQNVNEGPVITSSANKSVAENMTTVMQIAATDPDGDALTYSISGGADSSLFLVDSSTGALSFRNAPNFESASDADGDNHYELQITVDDGLGGSVTQSIVVTVTNTNEVPSGSGNSYSLTEDGTLTVAAPGLLQGATDEDGDALSASLVTGPANGSLSLNADGSFTYTPNAGFVGTDTFQFQVSDGSANSPMQTVTLTVNESGPSPITPTQPIESVPKEEAPSEPADTPSAETPIPKQIANSDDPAPVYRARRDDSQMARPHTAVQFVQLNSQDESSDAAEMDALARFNRAVDRSSAVAEAGLLNGFHASFDTGLLWQDLADFNENLKGRDQLFYLAAGSVATIGSMFTAGYVLWTIRGGWLASSLLAQMPAWRLIDPLVVLDQFDGDSNKRGGGDGEDDDSLESMLARNESAADQSDLKHEHASDKPENASITMNGGAQ